MKSLDTISEDLFNKIRGRFPSVTIGDENGKVTDDPASARFFDFDYKSNGESLGKVSLSITEKSLSVMYTNNFIEEASDSVRDNWYNFLKELRTFSKKRLLDFDTRDITKSNLDRRDYQFLAKNKFGDTQMSESKLYGTSNISYQRIGEARLNIRHRSAVNTEQPASRTRNIDRIYIESPEGERFRYPYRHLAGARAMARHVSEGGNPYDDFGKHVVGLSEELNNLKKFKTYVGRSRVMAEGLSQYMDIIEGRAKDVKKELESIQKSNGYANIIENYESVVLEDVPEDVKTNWIDELTIRQFNEDLKDVFPYIYRLIGEGTKAQELGPEDLENQENLDELAPLAGVAARAAAGAAGSAIGNKLTSNKKNKRKKNKGYNEAEDTDDNDGFATKLKTGGTQNPQAAKLDAEERSGNAKKKFDPDEIEKLEDLKQEMMTAYPNSPRHYLTYREKFAALKVSEPNRADKFKSGARQFDELIKSLGGSKKITSGGDLIFRLPKGFGSETSESAEEQDEQMPVTEYILSNYDRETGAWPRGETAVLTSVEKDYGENFIEPAKQFIEKINQTFEQYSEGCGCEEEPEEDEAVVRLKNLAGL